MEPIINGQCLGLYDDINLDNTKFVYDVLETPYDEKLQELTEALNSQVSNHAAKSRFRVNPSRHPKTNRIMVPTPSGYVTMQDENYTRCMVDIYNKLLDIGQEDSRILVNPALITPNFPDQLPNPGFKVKDTDLQYILDCKPAVRAFIRFSLSKVGPEDVKIKMKKLTSPGFPFSFANGVPYKSSDLTVGFTGRYMDPVRRFATNFKPVKESYVNQLLPIAHRWADNFSKPVDTNNILQRCLDFQVSVYSQGFRENSIDEVINLSGRKIDYENHEPFYGKDRPFAMYKNGKIITGMNNNKSYAHWALRINKSGFSTHRIRPICSHSFVTTSICQAFFQPLIRGVEESKYGFLSNKENVVNRYINFCEQAVGNNWLFVSGDRSHNESFVSTNWNLIKKVFPDTLRPIIDGLSYSVKIEPDDHRELHLVVSEGLQSGTAQTTFYNCIPGLCEALESIAKLTRCPLSIVVNAYCEMLDKEKDWMVFEGFSVLLFLTTDDIVYVVRGNKGIVPLPKDYAKNRLMKYVCSESGMSGSFGMLIDKHTIKPDPHAQLSKILFIERPGYAYHDCWSIYNRISLLDQSSRSIVLRAIHDYLGVDNSWLSSMGNKFLADLKALGLTPEDVLNEYSPKDQILLGSLIGMDDLTSVDRLDLTITESLYDFFKSLYKQSEI